MNKKLIPPLSEELLCKSLGGTSTENLYELAKEYFRSQDYSASIAVSTRCLSIGENFENFEATKPLVLIAQCLYKSNMESWSYLRPLALGITIHWKKGRILVLQFLDHPDIQLGISGFIVLLLIIGRIMVFERRGIFPKSLSRIVNKLRLIFL